MRRITYDVTIAVLTEWLPKVDPSFWRYRVETPYDDRLKLQLQVDAARDARIGVSPCSRVLAATNER